LFQSILWYTGGATFVSLERSMTRRAWRVRKRPEKLLILCLTVLVSCFPLSCSNYLCCFVGLKHQLFRRWGNSCMMIWSCEEHPVETLVKITLIRGP